MQKIPFIKMHGLGNDFVIIAEKDLPANTNMKNFSKNISNRLIGVGCDQFITYNYRGSEKDVIMKIYNIDGSTALACGNASRCLMRLIKDQYDIKETSLNVDGRVVQCSYKNEHQISAQMGEVSFTEDWMPSQDQLWSLAQRYQIEPKEIICVSVGNPHVVIFTKLSQKDKALIGRDFQNSPLFPDGINVNFAEIENEIINLLVFERSSGFTHACGSGAVATYAAAKSLGFSEDSIKIKFKLGDLAMQTKHDKIHMSGPAEYVFFGEYLYE